MKPQPGGLKMGSTRYMKLFMGLALAIVAMGSQSVSFAAATTPESFTEYFTVNESAETKSAETQDLQTFDEPTSFAALQTFFPYDAAIQVKKAVLNLLSWTLHNETLQQPTERYIRKLHFGRWINDPTDDTCMNTRAKVLVRDSNTDVTFRGHRPCVVEDGLWNDPYAGQEVTSSRQIQIDHMVPLKHAYVSGAWKWDYKTRCLFANFMGFKAHLVSAGASENMSKGDRGPNAYLPPNIKYRCEYIRNWLAIKMIWKLSLTSDEAAAIHDTVYALGCNLNDFKFTQTELKNQRKLINDNLNFCISSNIK